LGIVLSSIILPPTIARLLLGPICFCPPAILGKFNPDASPLSVSALLYFTYPLAKLVLLFAKVIDLGYGSL